MAQEGYATLPPDSTGKSVRTVEMPAMLSDGTRITVQMQVVALADRNGYRLARISELATNDAIHLVLRELRRIRAAIEDFTDHTSSGDDDEGEGD